MWTFVADRGEKESCLVRCRTLDELANTLSSPGVIKIDAEGAEVDVLRGGISLLPTAKPILIVEFSNDVLLAEGWELLPFYTFERLAAQHWMLQKE